MKNKAYDELIEKLEYELTQLKTQTQDIILLIEKAIGICEHVILRYALLSKVTSSMNVNFEAKIIQRIQPYSQVVPKLGKISFVKIYK